MSKGRKLLIALALLAILGAAVLALTRDKEPTYAGHTLYYWVEVHPPGNVEAIQAIGTNALPYLLGWIRYEPQAWRQALGELSLVHDRPLLRQLIKPDLSVWALTALSILGTNAAPALPDLVRLMRDPHYAATPHYGVYALACVGAPAIPYFSQALSDTSYAGRAAIVHALYYMPTCGVEDTNLYVPLIVRATTDPDPQVRATATNALGRIIDGRISSPIPPPP